MKTIHNKKALLPSFCSFLTLAMIPLPALFSNAASAEETTSSSRTSAEKTEASVESNALETQRAFFDAIGKKTLAFKFDNGGSALSKSERRSIRALIGAQDQSNETAYVAAWGDSELASDAKSAVRSASEKLAKNRIASVQDSLSAAGFKGRIVSINMVTKPSVISAILGTESEEVKTATTTTSDETTVRHKKIANVLESEGGYRKTVLVLVDDR